MKKNLEYTSDSNCSVHMDRGQEFISKWGKGEVGNIANVRCILKFLRDLDTALHKFTNYSVKFGGLSALSCLT